MKSEYFLTHRTGGSVRFVLCTILAMNVRAEVPPPDTLWTAHYSEANLDQMFNVDVTSDGGFLLAGQFTDPPIEYSGAAMRKVDIRGVQQWIRVLNRETTPNDQYTAWDAMVGPDGSCLMTGDYGGPDLGGTFLACYCDQGDSVWVQHIPRNIQQGEGATSAQTLALSMSGLYLVAGYTHLADDQIHARVFGFSPVTGTRLLTYIFPNPPDRDFRPRDIIVTDDGGFILIGDAQSRWTLGPWNLYVLRADSEGRVQWTRQYAVPDGSLTVFNACHAGNDAVLVSCRVEPPTYEAHDYGLLVKIGLEGDSLWSRSFSDEMNYVEGGRVSAALDGGFVYSGFKGALGTLQRLTSDGQVSWHSDFGLPQTICTGGPAIQLSDGGYVELAGAYNLQTGNGSTYLVRYASDGTRPPKSSSFRLITCYPNPFNSVAVIEWYQPHQESIVLSVYDVLGRLVQNPLHDVYEEGTHRMLFDAQELATGNYYVQLQCGDQLQQRRLLLIR